MKAFLVSEDTADGSEGLLGAVAPQPPIRTPRITDKWRFNGCTGMGHSFESGSMTLMGAGSKWENTRAANAIQRYVRKIHGVARSFAVPEIGPCAWLSWCISQRRGVRPAPYLASVHAATRISVNSRAQEGA